MHETLFWGPVYHPRAISLPPDEEDSCPLYIYIIKEESKIHQPSPAKYNKPPSALNKADKEERELGDIIGSRGAGGLLSAFTPFRARRVHFTYMWMGRSIQNACQ